MNLIVALLSRIEIKDIVALLILFMQLIFLIFVIYKAQKRADFDVANFLRDENGKESSTRAFAFLCLAVMSWGFAMLIFLDRMTEFYFFVFGGLWAGTPVAMEMVKRWDGSVPFGANRSVPNPHPTRQDPNGSAGSADGAGGGK